MTDDSRQKPRTSPHMVTTKATPTLCHRCGALILAAVCEGLSAHADLPPIDPADELQVLVTGRATYTFGANGELTHRDASRIRGGRLRGPILAEHRCHTPDPDQPPY